MKERIAILDGIRTPFIKADGVFKFLDADDLGAIVVKEILARTGLPAKKIDEVIFGNVAQPVHAANVSRVIALKAGLPFSVIAHTVNRNCASGMQSITAAANQILSGESQIIIAGGTESMSNIPLVFGSEMKDFFFALFKARSLKDRLGVLCSFRLRYLKPIIGVEKGLTDPICGMIMGLTAEVLSSEFHITRKEQDEFALLSHQRAVAAIKEGRLAEEIIPVPVPPDYKNVQAQDDGPRENQSREALQKLKPYFDRKTGTVTVGNSCPLSDGAAAVILTSESQAKALGLQPLGYLKAYAYAGLEGARMGLGPYFAINLLLKKTGLTMKDFELIEINEAFAAQIIANERAFNGQLDRRLFNVNGGAIALGHPVGTSGTRLVITLLKEMARRKKQLGLATLCVGGGQGAALVLETK